MSWQSTMRGWLLPLWLGNVALLASLTLLVLHGTAVKEILATPARALDWQIAQPSPVSSAPDLNVVQQAVLFYPTRQFFVASQQVVQIPKPDYRLSGTFMVPHKPAIGVLIHNGSGATRRVVAGDDLDGWTVLSIQGTRVTVRLNDEQYELTATSSASSASAGLASSTAVVAAAGGGLTRVPVVPAAITPTTSGVRVLGSGGSIKSVAGGSTVSSADVSQPRLYRPPMN